MPLPSLEFTGLCLTGLCFPDIHPQQELNVTLVAFHLNGLWAQQSIARMSLNLYRDDGCTASEFERSFRDPDTITCLTRRDSVGLAVSYDFLWTVFPRPQYAYCLGCCRSRFPVINSYLLFVWPHLCMPFSLPCQWTFYSIQRLDVNQEECHVANATHLPGQVTFISPTDGLVNGMDYINILFMSRIPKRDSQFSLICADIVQALGMILNLKWIVEGKVEIGGFCNAQGEYQPIFS